MLACTFSGHPLNKMSLVRVKQATGSEFMMPAARLSSNMGEGAPWPDLEAGEKTPWAFVYLLENQEAQRIDPTLALPWAVADIL